MTCYSLIPNIALIFFPTKYNTTLLQEPKKHVTPKAIDLTSSLKAKLNLI